MLIKTTKEQHELRAAYVAAYITGLAKAANLAWQETSAIINIALLMLYNGYSAATAYEIGAGYIRSISSLHNTGTLHD